MSNNDLKEFAVVVSKQFDKVIIRSSIILMNMAQRSTCKHQYDKIAQII